MDKILKCEIGESRVSNPAFSEDVVDMMSNASHIIS